MQGIYIYTHRLDIYLYTLRYIDFTLCIYIYTYIYIQINK